MSEVIRIQPLGGSWQTLGADRLRGIVAEGVSASANDWGPDALNFTIRAEAGVQRPDLVPFTPLEYEVDGDLVWAGFVWQRPADSNGYQVGCRGWQYHLDDNLFDRMYVTSRLSDFRDTRSYLATDLSTWRATGHVESSDGVISIGFPNGAVVNSSQHVGVTLDLGPDSSAKLIAVYTTTLNAASNFTYIVRGHDGEFPNPGAGAYEDVITVGMESLTDGTRSGTFTTPRRYMTILLYRDDGVSGAVGNDHIVKVNYVSCFRDASWWTGSSSSLKADLVVKDALSFAPLLNQLTARIDAGTFNIPEYSTGGYVTPRQAMESVNALENYRLKIGGDDLRTLVYGLKPSSPLTELGEWSGSEFTDATITGEDIYNKAIVDASGPDSARIVSKRGSAAVSVPSAYSDAGGGVGSTETGPTQTLIQAVTPPAGNELLSGLPYLISLIGGTVNSGGTTVWRIRIGGNATNDSALPPDDYVEFDFSVASGGATPFPTPFTVWVPTKTYTKFIREDYLVSGTSNSYGLNHRLSRGSSIPDRRHFARAKRVDVSAAITQAVADRIADLYLTEHFTAPFAGTLVVSGQAARLVATGMSLSSHKYLLQAGEKIRLSNRIDPDTGAHGRDGRIAGVTYTYGTRSVSIAIDDQRKKFETVLSRYASLVGG